MSLTVVVRTGDASSLPSITFDAPRIVIGRGDGCEVLLPDPSISHRHASIRQRGTDYIIVDEGSTNGTFVGPVRLSPHAPRVIRSGDLVRVGRIWLELRIEQIPPSKSQQQSTKEMALALIAGALAANGEPAAPRLRVVDGPDSGRELELVELGRGYVLGRGPRVELMLDDPDASRRHVEVTRKGAQLFVRDLASKNGSKLSDQPLVPNELTVWPKGARLEIGQDRLQCDDPVAEALGELEKTPDEKLREDDVIEPPRDADRHASESPHSAEPPAKQAPMVDVPRRKQAAKRVRSGWTGTDFAVAILALSVLLISMLGLFWLLRSQ